MNDTDLAIVGGGIAGLTAAAEAARHGLRVHLLERSARTGGRGISTVEDGFTFNLGPHALNNSHFRRTLDDFGVPYTGKRPGNYMAEYAGSFHRLPISAGAIATTRLFRAGDRLQFLRLLTKLMKPAGDLATTTIADWLNQHATRPRTRETAGAIFNFANYANAPELISMDTVAEQLKVNPVLYVDGGWQTLVDGLRAAVEGAGVTIQGSARVERIVPAAGGGFSLRLADGTQLTARSVILAIEPRAAANIVEGFAKARLAAWADAVIPARAATLDVALSQLPQPRRPFALGIDRPLYFSVHSAFAKLAPPGAAAVSVARYLEPTEDGREAESSLEAMLDTVQSGWRQFVVHRRFTPSLVVSQGVPLAKNGGLAGRPGPVVPGTPGLFVAGDWVGPQGLLSDAAAASARSAARLAAAHLRQRVDERVTIPA